MMFHGFFKKLYERRMPAELFFKVFGKIRNIPYTFLEPLKGGLLISDDSLFLSLFLWHKPLGLDFITAQQEKEKLQIKNRSERHNIFDYTPSLHLC